MTTLQQKIYFPRRGQNFFSWWVAVSDYHYGFQDSIFFYSLFFFVRETSNCSGFQNCWWKIPQYWSKWRKLNINCRFYDVKYFFLNVFVSLLIFVICSKNTLFKEFFSPSRKITPCIFVCYIAVKLSPKWKINRNKLKFFSRSVKWKKTSCLRKHLLFCFKPLVRKEHLKFLS